MLSAEKVCRWLLEKLKRYSSTVVRLQNVRHAGPILEILVDDLEFAL
jgi:hypothetical protein